MGALPKALRDGVDYLVTDPAPSLAGAGFTESAAGYCVQIWPVDTDAEHRVYLCVKCRAFTAPTIGAIKEHQTHHDNEQRQQSLVLEAWELLPKPIRDQLLKRARENRKAVRDGSTGSATVG